MATLNEVLLTADTRNLRRTALIVARHLTALAGDLEKLDGVPSDLKLPSPGAEVHYVGRGICETAKIRELRAPPDDIYADLTDGNGTYVASRVILDTRHGSNGPGEAWGYRRNTWHPADRCQYAT